MLRFKALPLWFLMIVLMLAGCDSKGDDPQPSISAPIATSAENITTTSFKASWNRVSQAQNYSLDISTNQQFTTFVNGYNGKIVSATYDIVENLLPNTSYFYRVRAVSGSVSSDNSNTIALKTLIEINNNVSLKEASPDFYIGVATQSTRLTGSYGDITKREFNSLTAEWEMKMNVFMPNKAAYDNKTYNFAPGDAIAAYAANNNMNLHGHALIWHNSTPDWIKNFTGTNDEFETIIKTYITDVVNHYKGKVKSWDVVNEAFEDGTGNYLNTVFYQKLGANYIAKCNQWVREADANVLIFYNDYNLESDSRKQSAAFSMIDNLITTQSPIDGVGFQMHISYNSPSKQQIETASQLVVNRHLKLHYSELDVRANPDNTLTNLTPERSLEQKAKVKEIVKIYKAIPADNKYALTVWGIKDNDSWLISLWGHIDWPLLFNNNFERKDAYNGFYEALVE